jgi:hypothetical protein
VPGGYVNDQELLVDLRLSFTDRAGRSLWAKSAATLAR